MGPWSLHHVGYELLSLQPYGQKRFRNWTATPSCNITVPNLGVRSLYGNVDFLFNEWLDGYLSKRRSVEGTILGKSCWFCQIKPFKWLQTQKVVSTCPMTLLTFLICRMKTAQARYEAHVMGGSSIEQNASSEIGFSPDEVVDSAFSVRST